MLAKKIEPVFIDTTLPPFTAAKSDSPTIVGEHMAALYSRLARTPPRVVDVWHAAAKAIGLPKTSPYYKAGLSLAAELDSGKGTGIAKGYHNTSHYIDVLLNATQSILRQNLNKHHDITLTDVEKGSSLFSGLAHDVYYVPGGNKTAQGKLVPYRLEKIAFVQAERHLRAANASYIQIEDVRLQIYGTDVTPASNAGTFVRAAYQHHFHGGRAPRPIGAQEELGLILCDPRQTLRNGMLCDNDWLPSGGLTVAYSKEQSARLGREWGKEMGPQDTLGFLQKVAHNHFITDAVSFFQPNMDIIRATTESELASSRPRDARQRLAAAPAPSAA